MVNIVSIEGKEYMVDVGFGFRSAVCPMLLKHGHEEDNIGQARSRLMYESIPGNTDDRQRLWVYQYRMSPDESWRPINCFTEMEFLPADFEIMNFYTSQYRRSWFTYTIMVVRYILEEGKGLVGALILFENELKRRVGSDAQTLKTCKTEEERLAVLEEYFDIRLSEFEKKGILGMNTQLSAISIA